MMGLMTASLHFPPVNLEAELPGLIGFQQLRLMLRVLGLEWHLFLMSFPQGGRPDGLSCGDCDRSRLWINAARFRPRIKSGVVQLRPAWRRA